MPTTHHRTDLPIYQARPSAAHAVQWLEDLDSEGQLREFAVDRIRVRAAGVDDVGLELQAGPGGMSGWVPIPPKGWVVRYVEGVDDFWPMTDEAFRAKYRLAPESG